MDVSQLLPLGEEVHVTCMQVVGDQLHLQVTSASSSACCPVCAQPATRIHSHYWRRAADLPSAGRQVRLLWRVRKFFCETRDCPRKIFAERLTHLAPWAQMTTRLSQVIQAIGLATCGRLGARLAARLGIATSWMTILRRVMDLAPGPSAPVSWLGIDDFSFLRGRTFGTVLVDLERHQLLDLLPDRQVETATAWMRTHPEIEGVSRDRGKDYAAAATSGAPQAVQVADRFHIAKNLTEAVQLLLARVLTGLFEFRQAQEAPPAVPEEHPVPVEEWRPTPGRHVQQAVAMRRAERESRYHHALALQA
jgi:transposase